MTTYERMSREALKEKWHEFSIKSQTEKDLFVADRFVSSVSGHVLSFNNMCMVLIQNPDATIVGGRRQWSLVGREVKQEEQRNGIAIWYPVIKKRRQPADEETKKVTFRTAYVYDITQTQLKEDNNERS